MEILLTLLSPKIAGFITAAIGIIGALFWARSSGAQNERRKNAERQLKEAGEIDETIRDLNSNVVPADDSRMRNDPRNRNREG